MRMSRTPRSIPADRLESAAAWLVKLEAVGEAQLTPEELQAWDEWAVDEANRAAFDELATLRQQVSAITAVRRPTRAELAADRVSDADPESPDPAPWRPRAAEVTRSAALVRRAWPLVLAASVLLAIGSIIAVRFLGLSIHPAQIDVATYSTRTGEQRRIELPDGSVITMGGASLLVINYTAHDRTVTLKRGEALFHDTDDPGRPFRVYAGNGVITALGTQFNVLRTGQRVTVTVAEGTVEIAPAPVMQQVHFQGVAPLPAPTWLPVRITRSEKMSYQSQGEATAVERADPKLAIAWTRGTLVYDRRPLYEVIADVKRYWDHPVTLDPGAAQLLYTGTVGERHIHAWIRGLPSIFPVSVTEKRGGAITIHLRKD